MQSLLNFVQGPWFGPTLDGFQLIATIVGGTVLLDRVAKFARTKQGRELLNREYDRAIRREKMGIPPGELEACRKWFAALRKRLEDFDPSSDRFGPLDGLPQAFVDGVARDPEGEAQYALAELKTAITAYVDVQTTKTKNAHLLVAEFGRAKAYWAFLIDLCFDRGLTWSEADNLCRMGTTQREVDAHGTTSYPILNRTR